MSKFGEGLGQISIQGWTSKPISELLTPPKSGLYSVKVKEWWLVDKNGNVLFYKGKTPQCNRDKRVVEHVYRDSSFYGGVVQLDIAMFPVDIKDYQ